MNNRMLALYGLKWNPFAVNVPTEALHVTPRLEFVLLAGATTGWRRWLRPDHRCARLRQIRDLAHPVGVAGHAARRHRRCDQPPTGQHRRLLPLMPSTALTV